MSQKKSNAKLGNVIGYTFPRLHETKEWYVDFQAIDPESGQLKRKKYHITKSSKREMRRAATALIERLGIKLRQGWTPWETNTNQRGTKLLEDIIEKFLSDTEVTSRKTTLENYKSRVNILREYLKENPITYAFQFDRPFITDFLDWTISKRGASPRTRNNYRIFCSILAEFMLERQYITENPVNSIKKLREPKKNRQPIDSQTLHQIFAHLKQTDPDYLLACMFEYYCFIRPNELTYIRIRDISVKDQTVFIPAEVSKNKMDGKVALNRDIIELMLELKTLQTPTGHYIFSKGFKPGPAKSDPDIFNKRWKTLRKALRLPSELKFYSLKDSGIRDLSNAKGVVTARDQARHQDISTTNIYLQGATRDAPQAAKDFRGALN